MASMMDDRLEIVVATGIEQNAAVRAAPPSLATVSTAPEGRLAELTARLRADNQRVTERVQKEALRPAAAPSRATADQIDRAALAAIAEAVSPMSADRASLAPAASYGDVSIRAIPPKPSLFPDHDEPMEMNEPAPPQSFIPPSAERMPLRARSARRSALFQRNMAANRFRNMAVVRLRRVLIRMAARRRSLEGGQRTIWISPHFCGVSRIKILL